MHVENKTAETVKPLNMRQQKFVDNYMASGNATRSAESAGYRHPNVQAFRLLENISVKASIEAIRANMSKESEDRRDRWISELEQLGSLADKDADRLRAIEQLFKAEGWLSPEKQEIVQFNGAFLADLDLDDDDIGEIDATIPLDNNDLH
tara:strand:- start:35 stop:484 length:450 start_codon:yes stop_codon:yes gene_type:complete